MKKLTIMMCTALLTLTCGYLSAQKITVTLAGNGIGGYNGDGKAGYLTQIYGPSDVCIDAAHNFYFIDQDNSRIRKVSAADGTVSTLVSLSANYMCIDAAGNIYVTTGSEVDKINAITSGVTVYAGAGGMGFGGDGGPAVSASFSNIQGICIDATGNIYIVDQGNNRIRKITAATGIVTTIAGNSTTGYTGDGGAAIDATLGNPNVIAVNSVGDVFFLDQSYSRIRRIKASTGIISTIAGTGGSASGDGGPATSAGLGGIYGICVDDSDNIYIDDVSCSCRKITMSTGIIKTVAGSLVSDGYNGDGFNSVLALLNFPSGLCVDHSGSIYVADKGNSRIRKAIQLSHRPSYAYGRIQNVYPCPGVTGPINDQLAITDVDSAQTETWTVLHAPVNGTLSGFPHTELSVGTGTLVTPTGLSYTTTSSTYTGHDSFVVRVSDGVLSDTVKIYVTVGPLSAGTITGPSNVCTGSYIYFTPSVEGGTYSLSNTNATAYGTSIYGSAAGMDTVIYSVSTGACTATTNAIISVNPTPSTGVVTSDTTICLGATITLTSTVTGGTWSVTSYYAAYASVDSVSGVTTALSPGSAEIDYTVSNAFCSATTSEFVTVIAAGPGAISGGDIICMGTPAYVYDGATISGSWSITNSNATLATTGISSATITGLNPGMDTIICSGTNMCGTGTTTKVITIDPAVDAGTITGPSEVCIGATITLISTVTGGYWESTYSTTYVDVTGGTVTGYYLGIDSIVYRVDGAACTGTTAVVINVITTPDAGTISGTVTDVCPGSTIILTESTTGGAWSTGNTDATVAAGVVTGALPGTDTILYVVTNSCGSNTTTYPVTIDDCTTTGVAATTKIETNGLQVYPNPATNEITLLDTKTISQVAIYDLLGQMMYSTTLNTANVKINISDLAAGVYFIKVNGNETRRFVVEK